ncbi:MAG: hypothetical protein M1536_06175 [Firmicutes bacterium]|nr:hypothetical protein [Bacillota bacterium]
MGLKEQQKTQQKHIDKLVKANKDIKAQKKLFEQRIAALEKAIKVKRK